MRKNKYCSIYQEQQKMMLTQQQQQQPQLQQRIQQKSKKNVFQDIASQSDTVGNQAQKLIDGLNERHLGLKQELEKLRKKIGSENIHQQLPLDEQVNNIGSSMLVGTTLNAHANTFAGAKPVKNCFNNNNIRVSSSKENYSNKLNCHANQAICSKVQPKQQHQPVQPNQNTRDILSAQTNNKSVLHQKAQNSLIYINENNNEDEPEEANDNEQENNFNAANNNGDFNFLTDNDQQGNCIDSNQQPNAQHPLHMQFLLQQQQQFQQFKAQVNKTKSCQVSNQLSHASSSTNTNNTTALTTATAVNNNNNIFNNLDNNDQPTTNEVGGDAADFVDNSNYYSQNPKQMGQQLNEDSVLPTEHLQQQQQIYNQLLLSQFQNSQGFSSGKKGQASDPTGKNVEKGLTNSVQQRKYNSLHQAQGQGITSSATKGASSNNSGCNSYIAGLLNGSRRLGNSNSGNKKISKFLNKSMTDLKNFNSCNGTATQSQLSSATAGKAITASREIGNILAASNGFSNALMENAEDLNMSLAGFIASSEVVQKLREAVHQLQSRDASQRLEISKYKKANCDLRTQNSQLQNQITQLEKKMKYDNEYIIKLDNQITGMRQKMKQQSKNKQDESKVEEMFIQIQTLQQENQELKLVIKELLFNQEMNKMKDKKFYNNTSSSISSNQKITPVLESSQQMKFGSGTVQPEQQDLNEDNNCINKSCMTSSMKNKLYTQMNPPNVFAQNNECIQYYSQGQEQQQYQERRSNNNENDEVVDEEQGGQSREGIPYNQQQLQQQLTVTEQYSNLQQEEPEQLQQQLKEFAYGEDSNRLEEGEEGLNNSQKKNYTSLSKFYVDTNNQITTLPDALTPSQFQEYTESHADYQQQQHLSEQDFIPNINLDLQNEIQIYNILQKGPNISKQDPINMQEINEDSEEQGLAFKEFNQQQQEAQLLQKKQQVEEQVDLIDEEEDGQPIFAGQFQNDVKNIPQQAVIVPNQLQINEAQPFLKKGISNNNQSTSVAKQQTTNINQQQSKQPQQLQQKEPLQQQQKSTVEQVLQQICDNMKQEEEQNALLKQNRDNNAIINEYRKIPVLSQQKQQLSQQQQQQQQNQLLKQQVTLDNESYGLQQVQQKQQQLQQGESFGGEEQQMNEKTVQQMQKFQLLPPHSSKRPSQQQAQIYPNTKQQSHSGSSQQQPFSPQFDSEKKLQQQQQSTSDQLLQQHSQLASQLRLLHQQSSLNAGNSLNGPQQQQQSYNTFACCDDNLEENLIQNNFENPDNEKLPQQQQFQSNSSNCFVAAVAVVDAAATAESNSKREFDNQLKGNNDQQVNNDNAFIESNQQDSKAEDEGIAQIQEETIKSQQQQRQVIYPLVKKKSLNSVFTNQLQQQQQQKDASHLQQQHQNDATSDDSNIIEHLTEEKAKEILDNLKKKLESNFDFDEINIQSLLKN